MALTMDADELELKIIMLGDTGVGKSSLLLRFTKDKFCMNEQYTIGVANATKSITHNEQKVKLSIWDTAGQERFRTLTHTYYRNAHGIILVYDTTSKKSFDKLEQWIDELNVYCNLQEVVIMVVANKIDLKDREVSTTDGLLFARRHKTLFLECSAKTSYAVESCFIDLVHKIMENPNIRKKNSIDRLTIVKPNTNEDQPVQSSYCSCSLI